MDQPWLDEPDEANWTDAATGLPCRVLRHFLTQSLNGYVGVPADHPWYGWDTDHEIPVPAGWSDWLLSDFGAAAPIIPLMTTGSDSRTIRLDCAVMVHGGLTYAGKARNAEEAARAPWWFGFDCMHAGDLSPQWYECTGDMSGVYRDMNYILQHCTRLAEQLQAAAREGSGVEPSA